MCFTDLYFFWRGSSCTCLSETVQIIDILKESETKLKTCCFSLHQQYDYFYVHIWFHQSFMSKIYVKPNGLNQATSYLSYGRGRFSVEGISWDLYIIRNGCFKIG